MMKLKMLKLRPNSRFHFGKPLVDSDTSLTDTDIYVHSDVLFSALVNNLAAIREKGAVDKFVQGFISGAIKISSAFYCIENKGNLIYLLPKPVDASNQVALEDYDNIKKIKKVQFIEPALLSIPVKDWCYFGNLALTESTVRALGFTTDFWNEKSKTHFRLFNKGLNTQVGIRATKMQKVGDQEVSVPKGPYHVSYIQIGDLSALDIYIHFYFLYELSDTEYQDDLDLAIDLLQFNGIGGERSSGYGSIEGVYDKAVPEMFLYSGKSDGYLSLSKIILVNKQELENVEAYGHSLRGGRETGVQKLKYIRMIDEGAKLKGEVKGVLSEISTRKESIHYRYGKAFLLPLAGQYKARRHE